MMDRGGLRGRRVRGLSVAPGCSTTTCVNRVVVGERASVSSTSRCSFSLQDVSNATLGACEVGAALALGSTWLRWRDAEASNAALLLEAGEEDGGRLDDVDDEDDDWEEGEDLDLASGLFSAVLSFVPFANWIPWVLEARVEDGQDGKNGGRSKYLWACAFAYAAPSVALLLLDSTGRLVDLPLLLLGAAHLQAERGLARTERRAQAAASRQLADAGLDVEGENSGGLDRRRRLPYDFAGDGDDSGEDELGDFDRELERRAKEKQGGE